jgi:hypothetical protein
VFTARTWIYSGKELKKGNIEKEVKSQNIKERYFEPD